ncbi:hypothetical protein GF406_09795 [candidate division KSB1 bacterium]|nr:hypothetical protein [candidate division KSB1 bacterium]
MAEQVLIGLGSVVARTSGVKKIMRKVYKFIKEEKIYINLIVIGFTMCVFKIIDMLTEPNIITRLLYLASMGAQIGIILGIAVIKKDISQLRNVPSQIKQPASNAQIKDIPDISMLTERDTLPTPVEVAIFIQKIFEQE